jgi:hypothetical protein
MLAVAARIIVDFIRDTVDSRPETDLVCLLEIFFKLFMVVF